MTIQENYSLLPHNTFGIEACCSYFAQYESVAELVQLLQSPLLAAHPFFHIGRGSNLLFLSDYQGVILHSLIKDIEVVAETDTTIDLRAGAGVEWDAFVAHCVTNGWGGVENLSAIPGEVGASAVQNIGAYGVEAKDVIVCVESVAVADGSIRLFEQHACNYSYRRSIFKEELKGKYIVTSVVYRLSKQPQFNLTYGNLQELLGDKEPTLQAIRDAVIAVRDAKLPDPVKMGNAGSFFMNPIIPLEQYTTLKEAFPDMPHYVVDESRVKVPAAWLIDRCGWKGAELGGAAVHDKQPLVLVNKNGATAADVQELAARIQGSIMETYGITISPEVNYIEGNNVY